MKLFTVLASCLVAAASDPAWGAICCWVDGRNVQVGSDVTNCPGGRRPHSCGVQQSGGSSGADSMAQGAILNAAGSMFNAFGQSMTEALYGPSPAQKEAARKALEQQRLEEERNRAAEQERLRQERERHAQEAERKHGQLLGTMMRTGGASGRKGAHLGLMPAADTAEKVGKSRAPSQKASDSDFEKFEKCVKRNIAGGKSKKEAESACYLEAAEREKAAIRAKETAAQAKTKKTRQPACVQWTVDGCLTQEELDRRQARREKSRVAVPPARKESAQSSRERPQSKSNTGDCPCATIASDHLTEECKHVCASAGIDSGTDHLLGSSERKKFTPPPR